MDPLFTLNLALVVVGGFVIITGLVSRQLRSWDIPVPLLAFLIGVLMGPAVFGLFRLPSGVDLPLVLEEAARLTLGIGLMGVAFRIPRGFFHRERRPLAALLGPGMLIMWLSTTILVYVLLRFPFPVCLLIGAIVTPTDPLVASSIVTGHVARSNLPDRLRNLISSESGANDGLAFLFVLLSVLIVQDVAPSALLDAMIYVVLWQVGVAGLSGALIGYGAGRLLLWAETRKTIERRSVLAYAIALAFATLGALRLMDVDGIFGVFVAGIVFSAVLEAGAGKEQEARAKEILEAVNYFLVVPMFVIFGIVVPWQDWLSFGWPAALLVVTILLFRRLPMLLSFRSLLWEENRVLNALFMGWFGPIGVSAIFYAGFAAGRTGLATLWPLVSLVVAASIVVHGLTATPLTLLYGRRAERSHDEAGASPHHE
ncbi:cation:proton antiporter domain-containing protein [Methanoculleus frigidifontis]|nr:cation:proton antiporter [Methanoculleus sp. FWC-SCC1]